MESFDTAQRQAGAKLKDRTSVRVKFMKDGMTQSGDFSIVEIDKAKYGKIDFNKGLIRYAADRFLEIELVTNTVTGLKIPLSSIVTKEFYKIPSAYLTVNKDQESGIMIQSTDKMEIRHRSLSRRLFTEKMNWKVQKKRVSGKYLLY